MHFVSYRIALLAKGEQALPLNPLKHRTIIKINGVIVKNKVSNKRQHRVEIQLSTKEREQIQSVHQSVPLARLIRNICLDKSDSSQTVINAADPKLIAQISAIGNLLNQATKLANHQKKSGLALDSAKLLLAIKAAEKALSEVRDAA